MNDMKTDTILIVVAVVLLIACVVFVTLSMMGSESRAHLPLSLGCVAVANALIIVRNRRRKK